MNICETEGARRPSLLFTTKRLDRLRKRIVEDPQTAAHWEQLRAKADQMLAVEWIDEMVAEGGADPQHGDYIKASRELADVVLTLSLVHSMKPDERFAAKIRSGLLHYAEYSHWSGPGLLDRNPPWRSELATATFCFSCALGFDVLHRALSAEERSQIVDALVDKGVLPILKDWLLPGTRIHSLDSMGHNWWVVCLSMAGFGAISLLGNRPEAGEWVDAIEQSMPEWFGYSGNLLQNKVANFDAAGAFYEGVGYANYALMEYLMYRLALTEAFPERTQMDCPQLRQAEQFFLHTFYPASDGYFNVNFGDAKIREDATRSMRLLLANGFGSGAGKWYVERATDCGDHPLALLLDDGTQGEPPQGLPTSILFPESSWVVMRSSWEDDATLLAARAGTYWNHAHADAGSFILFHQGRPLIEDPGYCPYVRPEYVGYYVTSQAHNVVLLDGRGAPQEDFQRGSKFPGKLHSLLDDEGLKYVYADTAGPMAHLLARHYRHWLWVDGAVIIFDDLLAHQSSRFSWLLHHAGTAGLSEQSVTIRNAPAEARVDFLYPGELDVSRCPAPAPYDADKQVTYLEFTTREAALRQNFIVAIIPSCPEGEPRVRLIEGKNYLGVRIEGSETTTDLFFNPLSGKRSHENTNSVFEGWETDANLLAVSRRNAAMPEDPRQASRILMIDGSYLSFGDESVINSLSKVDALVIPGPKRPRITMRGQPGVRVELGQTEEPDEVLVNGLPACFDYLPATRRIRFNYEVPN